MGTYGNIVVEIERVVSELSTNDTCINISISFKIFFVTLNICTRESNKRQTALASRISNRIITLGGEGRGEVGQC